jgi:hypothetical protein
MTMARGFGRPQRNCPTDMLFAVRILGRDLKLVMCCWIRKMNARAGCIDVGGAAEEVKHAIRMMNHKLAHRQVWRADRGIMPFIVDRPEIDDFAETTALYVAMQTAHYLGIDIVVRRHANARIGVGNRGNFTDLRSFFAKWLFQQDMLACIQSSLCIFEVDAVLVVTSTASTCVSSNRSATLAYATPPNWLQNSSPLEDERFQPPTNISGSICFIA